MNKTLLQIYAGFLGMNAGIRLGAPVEPAPWDYAAIKRFCGDIRGYVRDYKNFAADDDVNGPVYFLRALTDNGVENELTPQAVGEAWLNYARDGIGLYWWGGDGVSTEHTAYNNLKHGIPAPRSGSAEQNGLVLAEQIGGQIFIDTWGLICPGDPVRAVRLASTAASVSHDRNGLYGAAFMAAAIAAAFEAESVDDILDAGLAQIPASCTYRDVVEDVRAFHRTHPDRWEACMEHLIAHWGYDRYPGVCHIIPNAGVCALALCYGGGDFARTIEIAAMCGWDTDCNAGNVGTILGVFRGLDGIPAHYRDPINDFIVLSGVSGALNNLDAATYAKYLWQLHRRLYGLSPDEEARLPRGGELLFDFALPGSTHGLRLSNRLRYRLFTKEGGCKLLVDRVLPADSCDVYYKPFYRREDFDDERYKPVFSPTVVSGQTLTVRLTPHLLLPGTLLVRPYAVTAVRRERSEGDPVELHDGVPATLQFRLPDTCGDVFAEVGIHVEAAEGTNSRILALVDMDEWSVTGKGAYRIATRLGQTEFLQQTPFSHNHGAWSTQDGRLTVETAEPAQSFTGGYYATDVHLASDVSGAAGSCLMARAQGTRRYLAAGFLEEGRAGFRLHRAGEVEEYAADFPWTPGREYSLELTVRGGSVNLSIDGAEVLTRELPLTEYGMVGFAQELPGTGRFRDLSVTESGPFAPLL